jgi:TPR repeat protein
MDNDTSWRYDELAEKLAMGRVDVDEAAIPFVLEEARKQRDGNVIAHVASWYEDVKDDKARYLELAKEAAELGSPEANFWLGHEFLSGENLPRDYEKTYSYFIKGKDVDWVPIDPEENADYESGGEVEVTSEGLLAESCGDIGWWLFVLEKHPSRALKCGLADWYMKQGGDENRKRALKLLEESAKEGLGFARQKLAAL